jgi:hypothetical protein
MFFGIKNACLEHCVGLSKKNSKLKKVVTVCEPWALTQTTMHKGGVLLLTMGMGAMLLFMGGHVCDIIIQAWA